MYTRPWTLEERERLAYITNSPDHPLIVEAIEGDDEVRSERDHFEEESKDAEKRAEAAESEKEELETQVANLEGKVEELTEEVEAHVSTVTDLRRQIHAAGVDLV